MTNALTASQVVINGGGMAGALLAKALSPKHKVTLVDSNEYFEVPMSAPRSLVQPGFADGAIIPFKAALPGVSTGRCWGCKAMSGPSLSAAAKESNRYVAL